MINERRLVDLFLKYVQIDSESRKEENFREVLEQDLRELGMEVTVDEAGNLFFALDGDEKAEPLLFTAHMDTVVPGQSIRPVMENGVIKSGGDTVLGGDDKSGIAAIVEAIRVMKEEKIPHRRVEVLFTVEEEIGLNGSRAADLGQVRSRYSIAMDGCGPMDEIVVNGAGQANVEIEITGVAAHAGNSPEKGVSAVIAAADAVSAMKLLKVDEETTANIGTVTANSPANIVCSHIRMLGEVRSRDNEKLERQLEHMRSCVEQACRKHGASFQFRAYRIYEGYRVEDEAFLAILRAAYEKLGVTPKYGVTMVGSDSNILNQRGLKAVVLPTGMTNPHALTEQLAVKDLVFTAELVLELIRL